MNKRPWPQKCGCNAHIDQPHQHGCDWEECPFCHTQLISCNCDWPIMLDMTLKEARAWDNGEVSEEIIESWHKLLDTTGRVTWGNEKRLTDLYER